MKNFIRIIGVLASAAVLCSCGGAPTAAPTSERPASPAIASPAELERARTPSPEAREEPVSQPKTTKRDRSSTTAETKRTDRTDAQQKQETEYHDLSGLVHDLGSGIIDETGGAARVPDGALKSAWTACTPHEAAGGQSLRSLGIDGGWFRYRSESGSGMWSNGNPYDIDCMTIELNAGQRDFTDTGNAWESFTWDGYRAVWRRSGDEADVYILPE